MDISDEEDMFADDEIAPTVLKVNPIEEKLITDLNSVQNRIDQTKTNIEEFQSFIRKVLKQFAYRAKYGEDLEEDFGGEWFTISGEPIIESPAQKVLKCNQPLTVRDFHQCIIDDKWIILVGLRNTSNWYLKDLRFYVCLKNDNEINGTSTFWNLVDDLIWNSTEIIEPNASLIVATVVLDVPIFEEESSVQACGIILYEAEDKPHQTIVPNFDLSVEKTIDGTCTLDFRNKPEIDILAMKAVSVEKVLSFDIQLPGAGERFNAFLEKYCFDNIFEDIRVVRNFGSLKYCILEMLSITETKITIRISVRSSSQLSIVLTLLRQEFPDVPSFEEEEDCLQAANFLLQELELYLANETPAKIQRAQINCDLHIP